ncbi:MAG: TIGR03756 family integrating conjugative element protein, partial [Gammaproteobacteria bacterium]|nr:TIGR03756 family integrating conjugative element protein [Gammaproteobacteria bacterium]
MNKLHGLLLGLLLGLHSAAHAGTITTSQIVERTSDAALACMRWMPVGVCFWLRCSWSGCRVKSSLKVG